jgi:dTDP-4-dehydrorhamnose reductase
MAHHILLIGGHGKVAQRLTPLLLAKSWSVTSMIRNAEQKPAIEKLGQNQPGKLDVLVSSVADVKSEADAKIILDQVKPDWVVWSAGIFPYHHFCLKGLHRFLVTPANNVQEPAAKAEQK